MLMPNINIIIRIGIPIMELYKYKHVAKVAQNCKMRVRKQLEEKVSKPNWLVNSKHII